MSSQEITTYFNQVWRKYCKKYQNEVQLLMFRNRTCIIFELYHCASFPIIGHYMVQEISIGNKENNIVYSFFSRSWFVSVGNMRSNLDILNIAIVTSSLHHSRFRRSWVQRDQTNHEIPSKFWGNNLKCVLRKRFMIISH